MECYNISPRILAFTTDRSVGRDKDCLFSALSVFRPTSATGIQSLQFIYPHQTHSDHVLHVDDAFLAQSSQRQRELLEGVDAVISSNTDVVLGISTADCIPVIIYDGHNHAAAAIHAGWKGTVQRIVEKTFAMMQQTFSTDPSSCHAVIGPGISYDSFEVGREVVDTFSHAGFPMEQFTKQMPDMHGAPYTKPHIDLKGINRQQLLSVGIPAANIQVSGLDTYTDHRFFSARREQLPPAQGRPVVKCGRILTGFLLL